MKQIITLVLGFFLIASCSSNKSTVKVIERQSIVEVSNFNNSKLDSLFDLLEKNDNWMGSISISENGQLIYSKAIGYKDRATKKEVNTKSKYRIGSISKMFTSVMILKAAEEKKLKLESTIETYFPKVKNAKKITIENLLNHRSGIFNFTNREDYLTWNTKPQTKEELISMISGYESIFEPNSKSEYSNSNYILLSFILEEVYGKAYKNLLQEKITYKIGLKDTYFGKSAEVNKNETFSYSYQEDWIKSAETDMSIPLGAGSVVSSSSDLTQFTTALFGEKLISESSLNKMITLTDDYGLGIFSIPYGDKSGYGHTGGIDGFSSMLIHFPKENLSVAICSNGNNYDNNEIALCALSSYFSDGTFKLPDFTIIEVPEELLGSYLGVYSSKDIPLKITITKQKGILYAQGSGQPKMPLKAEGNHVFGFRQAGATFIFDTKDNSFVLKQGVNPNLKFTKE
jgi:CubicO group peptidase (beta-lactamase class C family)